MEVETLVELVAKSPDILSNLTVNKKIITTQTTYYDYFDSV